MTDAPIRMMLVGGFLGAGKTTLMAAAGRRLAQRGLNIGFITNDQAAGLVDTEMLKLTGFDVKEVAGACFCCKFDELILKTDELYSKRKPDVLITEPVGSCTDLSATVLQPIKKFFGDKLRVTPFSVLVDPERLKELLSGKETVFAATVLYIYSKQLEEADIIVLNKIDTLSKDEVQALKKEVAKKFPTAQVVAISALNGEGLDEWLELAMQDRPAGQNVLTIDYDKYAEGERVLGWLNAAVKLQSETPIDFRTFAFDLLRAFKGEFQNRKAEIAHLKLFISATGTGLVGNLTSTKGMPFVFVNGTAGSSTSGLLILNARVHIGPDELKSAVETTIGNLKQKGIHTEFVSLECFSPGRPNPTHKNTTNCCTPGSGCC